MYTGNSRIVTFILVAFPLPGRHTYDSHSSHLAVTALQPASVLKVQKSAGLLGASPAAKLLKDKRGYRRQREFILAQ